MRDVRVDINGTTDANGNASIIMPVPFTGAWYTVKFPIGVAGLAGAAEWAILASGTPLTYGRGRRVTLGPELIRDGEKITITVTGGPPNAAIFGSMNGSAGTPEEMLANFTPQPNTIAMDVTQRQRAIIVPTGDTVGGNTFVHASDASSFQIGDTILVTSVNGAVPSQTTGVIKSITAPGAGQVNIGGNLNIFGSFAFSPAAGDIIELLPGSAIFGAGQTVTVQEGPTPPPWQAAGSSVGLQGVALTINTDFTILAGVGGQRIRLFAVHMMTNSSAFTSIELWDGPSASGTLIGVLAQFNAAGGSNFTPMFWDGHGRPGTAGNALVGKPTNMSVGASVWGAVGVSQA